MRGLSTADQRLTGEETREENPTKGESPALVKNEESSSCAPPHSSRACLQHELKETVDTVNSLMDDTVNSLMDTLLPWMYVRSWPSSTPIDGGMWCNSAREISRAAAAGWRLVWPYSGTQR